MPRCMPMQARISPSAGILPAPYLHTGETPVLRIEKNVEQASCLPYPHTGETPVLGIEKNG
jgi:hypothetical protein